jgi:hypothetical protein
VRAVLCPPLANAISDLVSGRHMVAIAATHIVILRTLESVPCSSYERNLSGSVPLTIAETHHLKGFLNDVLFHLVHCSRRCDDGAVCLINCNKQSYQTFLLRSLPIHRGGTRVWDHPSEGPKAWVNIISIGGPPLFVRCDGGNREVTNRATS